MYKKGCQTREFPEIALHVDLYLDPENEWVKLADQIPWDEIELEYAQHFKSHGRGEVAFNSRVAVGALIIKEKLGLSDREVVKAVKENFYLQYFLGIKFQTKAPFSASLMTHFRKRLPKDVLMSFNNKMVDFVTKANKSAEVTPPNKDESEDLPDTSSSKEEEKEENSGIILMDATCAPADIKYPTDLNLVNDAREQTETIIDKLREQCNDKNPRPRTRRKICRKRYLEIIKHPKCSASKRRGAMRFLLNAVHRNLGFIAKLRERCGDIPQAISEQLNTIQTIYDQQRTMLDNHSRRIDDRIVSLHQPHVRPIVRGKAGRETEFGAKLTASLENGYARVERLSWDAYNESSDLQTICERYRERTGHYPEAVLADKLFRNRENLRYCAEHGIRLSGPRLGRPAKIEDPEILKQQLADNSARNAIEGKFGQCKRRFGLGRVMARRKDCSETAIVMAFIVANLVRWEKDRDRDIKTFFVSRFNSVSFKAYEPAFMLFLKNAA